MEIKLMDLSCKNFMGFLDFHHAFDGNSTDVLGDNGTGKTTLKSLFNWILFGKNAEGENDTNFAIRPLKADGTMLRQVDIEGSMVLSIDGKNVELKRVQKENWTKKRGTIDQEFSGNTTEYFIDGVPKIKKNYDAFINGIFDSEIFKLITDVEYFNSLHWKKQRDIVNNLLGVDEMTILKSNSEFAPLINDKTVDEQLLQIQSEQKRINKELELMPARIDERSKDIDGINKGENSARIEALNTDLLLFNDKLERLNKAKFKGENQELISQEEKKLSILNKEMDEIQQKERKEKNEYDIAYSKRKADLEREKFTLSYQLDNLTNSVTRFRKDIEIDEENVKALDAERTGLLTEYKEINGRIYVQGTCPLGKLCTYDDIKENGLATFNRKKAEDLENNKTKGLALKEKKNKLLARIDETKSRLEETLKEIDFISKSIETKEKEIGSIEYIYKNKYEDQIRDKQQEINDVLNRIDYLKSKTDDEELDKQIDYTKNAISKINDEIYDRKKVIEAFEMIDRYHEEVKDLQLKYERLEARKMLIEKYYKVRNAFIDSKNKEYFKLVKFKMYDEQINGGIAETCVATVKGVPYSDLNHAMKINAGLDIINSLQKIYNIQAPIWIDNAEAITKFEETNSQLIKLYVAEGYKKLEFQE